MSRDDNRLRARIARARAAIARDEQALTQAIAGRDLREVAILENHLKNRRAHLIELLEEQARLPEGYVPPE